MASQRVTMKDVAKAAGVTTAAVSYAISGKRPISDETRKRVEQAIKELGYTPNMAARTLSSAGNDSKLIGVVVPQTEGEGRLMFQNQFYQRDTRQHRALRPPARLPCAHLRHGRERELPDAREGAQPRRDNRHRHVPRRVLPADEEEPDTHSAHRQLLQRHYYHNVRIDDAYGSYLATKYVLENGHRDIAFFCGRLKDNGVMKKRLAGYRDALAEFRRGAARGAGLRGGYRLQDGIASANRLLDTRTKATAVVAAADILAIGAKKAFYERGVRVPEDISLMGFDDLEISQ